MRAIHGVYCAGAARSRSATRGARCSRRWRSFAAASHWCRCIGFSLFPERGHPAVPRHDRDAGRREPRGHRSRAALRRGGARAAHGSEARTSRTSAAATRVCTTTSSPKRPTPTSARCSSSSSEYDPRAHAAAARASCARDLRATTRARASRSSSYRNGPPIEAPIEIARPGTGPRPAAAARRTGRRRSSPRRPARATSTIPRVACGPTSTCASTPTRPRCSASTGARSIAPCAPRSPA